MQFWIQNGIGYGISQNKGKPCKEKPQEKNKRLVVTAVCCRTVGVWLSRYQILFPSLVSNSIVSNSCERQKTPSRTSSSFQFPKISGQVPSISCIIYNCCISPVHSYSTKKAAFYVSAWILRTDVLYSPRINVQINIIIMIKIEDNKRKVFFLFCQGELRVPLGQCNV